jgi:phosphoribosylaminoimidazolecarboxamide formyltransferase / IMP cyclohydrolase
MATYQLQRALLSVSDKTGLIPLASALHAQGVLLLSTGGTAKAISDAGLPVTEISAHTGFPEMLDGRVKTLHPKVHGGFLARRDLPEHMQTIEQHGIDKIDLLVVNLYPFEQTVAKPNCTLEDAIENIDIGGPAMLRSAAKNCQSVAVLTDPAQYSAVIDELNASRTLSRTTLFSLGVAAFNRVAQYDAAISDYLSSIQLDQQGKRAQFPAQSNSSFIKLQDLRYGENPHQAAAFYRDIYPAPGSLATYVQLQGKELSYNNLADADAAWECVRSFDSCACVIVKHANPCGVALSPVPMQAYQKAFACDPTSAFGGIIAFNVPMDGAAAAEVAKQFVEVVIAPAYTAEALAVFKAKPNARLIQIDLSQVKKDGASAWQQGRNANDVKRVGSGLLIQSADIHVLADSDIKVVTIRQPSPAELKDARFAWTVAQYVKSNAIVFCKDSMTIGVGAGQMSRLDSARIASIKAGHANLSLQNTVVASDAFFPFRDGLDVVVDAGATCIIQPGGSVRDDEVIAAANERQVAMLFTGVRHFRH